MKVLVIGRQGQLAQCLAALPARAGLTLALAGRPEADVARPESVRRAIAEAMPDVVVNTAAYTAVDRAEREPDSAFAINANGAEAVARAAAERGLPIIHVSTDYVFDGIEPRARVETDPTGPTGAYGRSKLAGEERVAAANPRHVIARTAWLIGPYGQNFLKTMLRLAAERDELRVVADQTGSPTYAPDLAQALVQIAQRIGHAAATDPRWGVYHATSRGTATWHDLACAIVAASAAAGGRDVPVRAITTAEFPTPAARPKHSALDCGKLERVLGIVLPDWRSRIGEGVRAARARA